MGYPASNALRVDLSVIAMLVRRGKPAWSRVYRRIGRHGMERCRFWVGLYPGVIRRAAELSSWMKSGMPRPQRTEHGDDVDLPSPVN